MSRAFLQGARLQAFALSAAHTADVATTLSGITAPDTSRTTAFRSQRQHGGW